MQFCLLLYFKLHFKNIASVSGTSAGIFNIFFMLRYYPKCTLSAEVCGFGHPFCGEYCMCGPTERSLQKNHRAAPSTRSPPPATVCNGFQQQKLQKLDVVWKNTVRIVAWKIFLCYIRY